MHPSDGKAVTELPSPWGDALDAIVAQNLGNDTAPREAHGDLHHIVTEWRRRCDRPL